MRKKIKHKIPEAHQTAASPPSITSVLGYLRQTLGTNLIYIHDDSADVELATDLDEDLNIGVKASRPRRKQVKSDIRHVPTALQVLLPNFDFRRPRKFGDQAWIEFHLVG
jgi:hypothetical protein